MLTKLVSRCLLLAFCIYGVSCQKVIENPSLKNKLVFIYKNDNTEGLAYQSLMQENGCSVYLLEKSAITSFDFSGYDLIVIGNNSDTIYGPSHWTPADTMAFYNAAKPMLLWGAGGYQLEPFYKGVSGNVGSGGDQMQTADRYSVLYNSPRAITMPATGILNLYLQISNSAYLYTLYYPPNNNLEVIGKNPIFQALVTVYFENRLINSKVRRYGTFGYCSSVNGMTPTGRDFIVNFTYYVGQLKQ